MSWLKSGLSKTSKYYRGKATVGVSVKKAQKKRKHAAARSARVRSRSNNLRTRQVQPSYNKFNFRQDTLPASVHTIAEKKEKGWLEKHGVTLAYLLSALGIVGIAAGS